MALAVAAAGVAGGAAAAAPQPGVATGAPGTAAVQAPAAPGCGAEARLSPRLRLPPAAAPRVALTIDACGGRADARVLEGLAALGVPATVFVTAIWLRGNPAAVALLRRHAGLFSLQNHGERHIPAVLGTGRLFGLPVAGSLAAVRAEVAGGAAAIRASGAPAPRWYRGATALYSAEALAAIRAEGWRIGGFSLNADEGASLPAAAVARRVAAARDGDVIIAHANRPDRPSGPGLVEGVAALRARGIGFVHVPPEAIETDCAPRRLA
jgi:peptidoglycan/xylan/chitin deacetylase (PgdA/CDA1 family)